MLLNTQNKNNTLSQIKNISTLDQLVKFDKELRVEAIKLAKGNKAIGEDALHDAYLFIYDYLSQNKGEKVSGRFVLAIIEGCIN